MTINRDWKRCTAQKIAAFQMGCNLHRLLDLLAIDGVLQVV